MWRYKAWPVESFRELIATLVADGHQVVLTGGPSANDRRAVAEMAQIAPPPRVLDVCGRLDFGQLATLLGRSALYIGTDTSVTHLAAACSVPTIALFGPTNPMRWGPLDAALPIDRRYAMQSDAPQRRGRVILMQGPGACVPCAGRGCEGHDESHSACLDALAPAQVIAEARAVLRR
nr:glycosyltransferase family 9 protein [Schlegelella koreensis]